MPRVPEPLGGSRTSCWNVLLTHDYRVFVSPVYSNLGFDDADLLVDRVRIHEMNPEWDVRRRRLAAP